VLESEEFSTGDKYGHGVVGVVIDGCSLVSYRAD
jgi:hypothetical protein